MYKYFVKFKSPGEKWVETPEHVLETLLRGHFKEEEIKDQIYKMRCGHTVETISAKFKAFIDDGDGNDDKNPSLSENEFNLEEGGEL